MAVYVVKQKINNVEETILRGGISAMPDLHIREPMIGFWSTPCEQCENNCSQHQKSTLPSYYPTLSNMHSVSVLQTRGEQKLVLPNTAPLWVDEQNPNREASEIPAIQINSGLKGGACTALLESILPLQSSQCVSVKSLDWSTSFPKSKGTRNMFCDSGDLFEKLIGTQHALYHRILFWGPSYSIYTIKKHSGKPILRTML